MGAGSGLVGLQERVLLCGGQMEAGAAGPGYLLRSDAAVERSPRATVVDGTA